VQVGCKLLWSELVLKTQQNILYFFIKYILLIYERIKEKDTFNDQKETFGRFLD